MTSITTRAGKGTPLTHTEVDDNFTNLNADKLEASNNLSDVSSASAARTNLGLGTAATTASTDYATAAQGTLADSAVQPNDSPTFAGLTTTANVSFGDNDKAIFGDGSDLQIFHSGSSSWIRDLGTGGLVIDTDGALIEIKGSSPTEYMARFIKDGAVSLYHDNSAKLATTSTGVDVTGTITSDGLTVIGGDVDAVSIGSDGHVQLYDTPTSSRSHTFLSRDITNSMVGGNIRLDASVTTGSHIGYSNGTDARGGSGIVFENTPYGASAYGEIKFLQSNDTNDDTWVVREAMRIDSSGNVGIGTSSPTTALDVDGTVTAGNIIASGTEPYIRISETDTSAQHRIISSGANLYIQAMDSDGTYDGDMHLTGYQNNDLRKLSIKALDTTLSGKLTLPTNTYHYSSDGKPRLYYFDNGDTIFRTADDFQFRNNDNTTIAQISETGAISTISTVTATSFIGDGSNLTGISSATLQVKQGVKTDTAIVTGGQTYTIASVTITPSSTSSKILIRGIVNGYASYDTSLQFFRGSTKVGHGDASGSRVTGFAELTGGTRTNEQGTGAGEFLDSPATTSAITYYMKIYSNSQTIYINRSAADGNATYDSRTISSITVMEIGA